MRPQPVRVPRPRPLATCAAALASLKILFTQVAQKRAPCEVYIVPLGQLAYNQRGQHVGGILVVAVDPDSSHHHRSHCTCEPPSAALCTEAKELASWGAELAEADASDAEQLRGAFEGAYGVYGMTFSAWAIADPQEGIEFEYNLGAHDAGSLTSPDSKPENGGGLTPLASPCLGLPGVCCLGCESSIGLCLTVHRDRQRNSFDSSIYASRGTQTAWTTATGKAQADAAAAAGVKVFVFSTLEEIEHRVQAHRHSSRSATLDHNAQSGPHDRQIASVACILHTATSPPKHARWMR